MEKTSSRSLLILVIKGVYIYHHEDSVALRDLSSASPNLSAATSIMSILNLATKSNDRLKKLAQECISLDDVYDKCENCGCPVLLHPDRTKHLKFEVNSICYFLCIWPKQLSI